MHSLLMTFCSSLWSYVFFQPVFWNLFSDFNHKSFLKVSSPSAFPLPIAWDTLLRSTVLVLFVYLSSNMNSSTQSWILPKLCVHLLLPQCPPQGWLSTFSGFCIGTSHAVSFQRWSRNGDFQIWKNWKYSSAADLYTHTHKQTITESSGRRNVTPIRHTASHMEVKSPRNGRHIGKCKSVLLCWVS